jgi:hypothetical protein
VEVNTSIVHTWRDSGTVKWNVYEFDEKRFQETQRCSCEPEHVTERTHDQCIHPLRASDAKASVTALSRAFGRAAPAHGHGIRLAKARGSFRS